MPDREPPKLVYISNAVTRLRVNCPNVNFTLDSQFTTLPNVPLISHNKGYGAVWAFVGMAPALTGSVPISETI